jgi:hypothetical protein
MTNSTIEIHSTDRQAYKRCRQAWDFSSHMRMNLEPIRTSMNALDFGTGIHYATAEYYDRGRQLDIAKGAWYNYCGSWLDYDVDDETIDLGVGMLTYFHNWSLRNDKFTWLGSELESKLQIGRLAKAIGNYPAGTPIIYSYRLDGFVQKDGLFYIVERKTAGKWESSYDYLLTDDQAGSYLWCEQLRRGVPVEGVIYDIHRKAVPKPLRVLKNGEFSAALDQDTTEEIATKALRERYQGNGIPPEYQPLLENLRAKPDNFVQRHIVRRNQAEIKRIGEAIFDEIADMLRAKIYRTPSAWNCNNCAFLNPCITRWEGGDYRQALQLTYQSRKPRETVDA